MRNAGSDFGRGAVRVAIVCVGLTFGARLALATLPPKPEPTCFAPLVPTPALANPLLFGRATARSGDVVVVGVDDDAAVPSAAVAGAIYTFQGAGLAWSQQGGPLRPADSDPGDGFGEALALAGNTLLAGARGRGGAYVFERTAGAWSQRAYLAPPMAAHDELHLALEGDTAVLSLGYSRQNQLTAGVFVYTRGANGDWVAQGDALTIPNDELGEARPGPVSISGDTLLVGAPVLGSYATSAGKAFVFVRQAGQWQRQGPALTGDDNSLFGVSVALSGETALIGSDRSWGANPSQPNGSVYAFVRHGQSWAAQGPPWRQAGVDSFGRSLSILGDRAFVGAPVGLVVPQGAVFSYRRTGEQWAPAGIVYEVGFPRQDPEVGASIESTSAGLAVGSTGVAYAADLTCLDARLGLGGASGAPSQGGAGMGGAGAGGASNSTGGTPSHLGGAVNVGGALDAGQGSGACSATDDCVHSPAPSDGDATASACGCRLAERAPAPAGSALVGLAALAVLARRKPRRTA